VTSSPVPATVASNDIWPMAGYNEQHNSRSPYKGPSDPQIKWGASIELAVTSPFVIARDGTIYYGSYSALYAINPDGTQKWKLESMSTIRVSSIAISKEGDIYLLSNGGLHILNPDSSEKKFFPLQYGAGHLTLTPDGTVYIGDTEGFLYAYDHQLNLLWKYKSSKQVLSDPAVSADGSVYFISADKNVFAVDKSGTLKWKYPSESIFDSTLQPPAIAPDGTIILSLADGINALDPSGGLKWKFAPAGYSRSFAIGADGTIYLDGGDNPIFYAINNDGTEKWRFEKDDSDPGSATIIDSQGVIYFGCEKTLYAINPDGSLKWKMPTEDTVSSPFLGNDDTLYIRVGEKLFSISSK
jgi:outer membrane protein assembly factor BamB